LAPTGYWGRHDLRDRERSFRRDDARRINRVGWRTVQQEMEWEGLIAAVSVQSDGQVDVRPV
jgi:predicted methyltransferase